MLLFLVQLWQRLCPAAIRPFPGIAIFIEPQTTGNIIYAEFGASVEISIRSVFIGVPPIKSQIKLSQVMSLFSVEGG